MPSPKYPNSYSSRLTFLRTALAQTKADRDQGRTYISQATLTQLEQLLPVFEQAIYKVNFEQAQRSSGHTAVQENLKRLEKYVRTAWRRINDRVDLGKMAAADRRLYGFAISGSRPEVSQTMEWVAVANYVIMGESSGTAAGYAPLSDPTIAELQTQIEAVNSAAAEAGEWETSLKEARAALRTLSDAADELIREVVAELTYALRRQPKSVERDIMRAYGRRYYSDPEFSIQAPPQPETITLTPDSELWDETVRMMNHEIEPDGEMEEAS